MCALTPCRIRRRTLRRRGSSAGISDISSAVAGLEENQEGRSLGRVDGSHQEQTACEGDNGGEAQRRLLASRATRLKRSRTGSRSAVNGG
jgi:hypothetical protein